MRSVQKNETLIEDQSRIEWLTSNELIHIGTDDSGWQNLYQNQSDKTFWFTTYPHSEMHGGGPINLKLATTFDLENIFKNILNV